MRAGNLREQVRIEQVSGEAPDSYGELVETWATLCTVRAQVTMGGAGLVRSAGYQIDGQQVITVRIRYRPDINVATATRFVWLNYDDCGNDLILEIQGIQADMRRTFLDCSTKARTADGFRNPKA